MSDEFTQLKDAFCEKALLRYLIPNMKPAFMWLPTKLAYCSVVPGEVTTGSWYHVPVEQLPALSGNIPNIDLEALAVDFASGRFRQYTVGGPKVTVITDNRPLEDILVLELFSLYQGNLVE